MFTCSDSHLSTRVLHKLWVTLFETAPNIVSEGKGDPGAIQRRNGERERMSGHQVNTISILHISSLAK